MSATKCLRKHILCFPFFHYLRFGIPVTLPVKWKGFSWTSVSNEMVQEAKKVDVALPQSCEIVGNFGKERNVVEKRKLGRIVVYRLTKYVVIVSIRNRR